MMTRLFIVLVCVLVVVNGQCSSASSNASACLQLYIAAGSQCGFSVDQQQCTTCMGGLSGNCNANPPPVSPCIYSPAVDACISSGFPCDRFNFSDVVCNHSTYFLRHCSFDTGAQACRPCSEFSASNCPAPNCNSGSGTCQASMDVCASFTDKASCVQSGAAHSCYFNDAASKCYYCGQLDTDVECNSSPICRWDNAAQFCIVGASPTSNSSSWGVGIILAIALPVAAAALFLAGVAACVVKKRCASSQPKQLDDDMKGSATIHSSQKDVTLDNSTTAGASSLHTTRRLSELVLTMPSGSASSAGNGSELALLAPALFQDGRVQRLKLLGRGANGSVYSCMLPDGYLVAMKEILLPPPNGKSGHEELIATIMKEVSIVSSLDHPNVVRFFGSALEPDEHRLTIFMELIPNGSLASMVTSMPEPMKEDVARVLVRQLVAALAYIHEKGVVHRDVKCDNVLLNGEGRLKLTDFGASKTVGTGTLASRGAQTMIGTPYFMAPEILVGLGDDSDGSYGRRADIWSLGITVVEMMQCGKPPWPDFPSTGAAFMHIATPGSLPIIPERFSDGARDFVLQCCKRDPLERSTAKMLLTHPWLVSNFDVEVK
jgi:hypothetical protein